MVGILIAPDATGEETAPGPSLTPGRRTGFESGPPSTTGWDVLPRPKPRPTTDFTQDKSADPSLKSTDSADTKDTRARSFVGTAPTQAFLAAKRLPHLIKLQDYLQSFANSDEDEDRLAAFALCREQLSLMWPYVDVRDEAVAQYLDLIASSLKTVNGEFTPQKAEAVVSVCRQLAAKRYDFEARRLARKTLLLAGALGRPEPTLDAALSAEAEELADTTED
ncbi:MAG: hypothetical protein ABSE64_09850 [Vulcanimicrobiaceae bacterium]|jgi:hypothetical protein